MRNWINLITEFQLKDVEKLITTGGDEPPPPPEEKDKWGEGDRPEMVRVTGICWYKDNEDQDEVYSNDLPTEVTIPIFADPDDEGSQMIMITIENELEARYGFRHNARPMFFEYTFV